MRNQNLSDAAGSAAKGALSPEPEVVQARRASRRALYSVIGAALVGVLLALFAAIAVGAAGLASWRDAFFGTADTPSAPPIEADGYKAGALISADELDRLGDGLREKRGAEDRSHAERLKELDATLNTAHERLKLEDPAARFGPDFAAPPPGAE